MYTLCTKSPENSTDYRHHYTQLSTATKNTTASITPIIHSPRLPEAPQQPRPTLAPTLRWAACAASPR